MALCRVCLVGGIRLLDLSKNLLEVYGKLTDTELDTESEYGMPSTVCYVCHRQLQRFQMFSEMARKSNKILQDLLRSGTEVTHSALKVLLEQPLNALLNFTVTPTEHSCYSDFTNTSCNPVAVKDEPILEDNEEETLMTEENYDIEFDESKSESLRDIQVNNNSNEIDNIRECKSNKEETLENYDIKFEESKLESLRYIEVNNDSNETDNIRECKSNVKADINCFYCDVCNKIFYKRNCLVQHLRVHTKMKACKTCDKRFTTNSELKVHMQIHTGEKPYCIYACNRCDKKFTKNYKLERHMRIHTGDKPYSCNRCDKTFSQNCNLKNHMLIHTGEKPYSCNRCVKLFRTKRCLVRHMRIHTGEMPYSCNRCLKKFSRKYNLTHHMRIHT